MKLRSDAGDYIGGGGTYSYSLANSVLRVTASGARLSVAVNGDQNWSGEFQLPNSYTDVRTGVYGNVKRYPFHDPAIGGLSWIGEGRGCNTSTGSFTIKRVTYDGTALSEVELQFEQYCEGGSVALRGDIYWNAKDTTTVAGPSAAPANLWQPASGTTPANGSYIYLESTAGDYIGAGGTYLYTQSNATLRVSVSNGRASVSVNGDESWGGDFQAMNSINQLAAGYYPGLTRYPFHNPTKGGLSWSGEGRGCNTLTGWFVVDRIAFNGTSLTALDLRFEQHCEGGTAALRGRIHWDASDPTTPPGPVGAPPPGLWEPAPGTTPASGNYVYLESEQGDYIGAGARLTYTQANSLLRVSANGGLLTVGIAGDEDWSGDFQAMNTVGRLERGYYGDLQRYPFHNPAKGGLSWAGDGRGCNTLSGWFVVDDVVYSGTALASIDLRFEQHCEGLGPALRGKIHWTSSDTTAPPGPASVPPNLWQPAPGVTPASGNYVYLESPVGDYIGQGGNYSYTQANATLIVAANSGRVTVSVRGDEDWSGDFQPMISLNRLEPGYYGDLQRYPFQNPVKGGLSWSGEGRGCNTLTGWFVVDDVVYSGNALASIDLRFEQRCEGIGAPLHGKIHWSANDPTTPPGPVPPPAGLWQPTPGITPATGNFVYLESQQGDYIGGGGNYLYTSPSAPTTLRATGAKVDVSVADWTGTFIGMNSISRLEAGYYGGLERFPFHNPTKGGLDWTGQHRGCNTLTGWFVVDAVTYTGVTMTGIDLRFEQHCEGGVPALRGQIRWRE